MYYISVANLREKFNGSSTTSLYVGLELGFRKRMLTLTYMETEEAKLSIQRIHFDLFHAATCYHISFN
jgi:hypothetical protein